MDDGQRVIARQGERERRPYHQLLLCSCICWLVGGGEGEERKEAAKDDKRWLAGMFDYKVASRKQIAPVAWRRLR